MLRLWLIPMESEYTNTTVEKWLTFHMSMHRYACVWERECERRASICISNTSTPCSFLPSLPQNIEHRKMLSSNLINTHPIKNNKNVWMQNGENNKRFHLYNNITLFYIQIYMYSGALSEQSAFSRTEWNEKEKLNRKNSTIVSTYSYVYEQINSICSVAHSTCNACSCHKWNTQSIMMHHNPFLTIVNNFFLLHNTIIHFLENFKKFKCIWSIFHVFVHNWIALSPAHIHLSVSE